MQAFLIYHMVTTFPSLFIFFLQNSTCSLHIAYLQRIIIYIVAFGDVSMCILVRNRQTLSRNSDYRCMIHIYPED
jgi:hypothetical protein